MSALSTLSAVRDQIAQRRAQDKASNLQDELIELMESNANPDAVDECLRDLLEMLHPDRSLAERTAGVEALTDIITIGHGDDLFARIGRIVRDSGSIEDLRDLLLPKTTRNAALLVLGNLVSDAVDEESSLTKEQLLRSEGAVFALRECLEEASDVESLTLAVGCLQNLCHDQGWSEQLVKLGVHMTLEALLEHPDATVLRYVSGALKNISATTQTERANAAEAIHERSFEADVEDFRSRRAASAVVRAIQKVSPDVRLRRLHRATECEGEGGPSAALKQRAVDQKRAERAASRRPRPARPAISSSSAAAASAIKLKAATTALRSSESGAAAPLSIVPAAAPPQAPPTGTVCFEV